MLQGEIVRANLRKRNIRSYLIVDLQGEVIQVNKMDLENREKVLGELECKVRPRKLSRIYRRNFKEVYEWIV